MTEAEWCACSDPCLQLVFLELEGRASERKARLYACGVGRSLWPFLGDERSRRAVEVAEKYADGRATATELAAAKEAALDANKGVASQIVCWVPDHGPWQGARMVVVSIQQSQRENAAKDWWGMIARRSRELLPCVFGDPFRPVRIDPSWLAWRDGTAAKIAEGIYEDRASDRLPILGDSLEDAGCTNANILGHCRGPGPHVRGCWVVDLLLAKE